MFNGGGEDGETTGNHMTDDGSNQSDSRRIKSSIIIPGYLANFLSFPGEAPPENYFRMGIRFNESVSRSH